MLMHGPPSVKVTNHGFLKIIMQQTDLQHGTGNQSCPLRALTSPKWQGLERNRQSPQITWKGVRCTTLMVHNWSTIIVISHGNTAYSRGFDVYLYPMRCNSESSSHTPECLRLHTCKIFFKVEKENLQVNQKALQENRAGGYLWISSENSDLVLRSQIKQFSKYTTLICCEAFRQGKQDLEPFPPNIPKKWARPSSQQLLEGCWWSCICLLLGKVLYRIKTKQQRGPKGNQGQWLRAGSALQETSQHRTRYNNSDLLCLLRSVNSQRGEP